MVPSVHVTWTDSQSIWSIMCVVLLALATPEPKATHSLVGAVTPTRIVMDSVNQGIGMAQGHAREYKERLRIHLLID